MHVCEIIVEACMWDHCRGMCVESLWGTCLWDHCGGHVCGIIVEIMYVGSL